MAIETEKEMMDARAEAAEARHEAGLRVEEAVRASEVAVQTLEAEKASLLQKRRDLETNLERLSEENHQLKQRVLHLSSDDDEGGRLISVCMHLHTHMTHVCMHSHTYDTCVDAFTQT